MKSSLNLNYDIKEKKLYLNDNGTKVFVYLKIVNDDNFIIPIDSQYKSVKMYNSLFMISCLIVSFN